MRAVEVLAVMVQQDHRELMELLVFKEPLVFKEIKVRQELAVLRVLLD
jgi:hypothetical protein